METDEWRNVDRGIAHAGVVKIDDRSNLLLGPQDVVRAEVAVAKRGRNMALSLEQGLDSLRGDSA